jgi:hypothetical protein
MEALFWWGVLSVVVSAAIGIVLGVLLRDAEDSDSPDGRP